VQCAITLHSGHALCVVAQVTRDWVKPGAVVLDVGINVREKATQNHKHKLVGDVNFEDVSGVASALTPVPGGWRSGLSACDSVNLPRSHDHCCTRSSRCLNSTETLCFVDVGVGPMTIAALLHNTIEAAKRHADIWKPRS
jgi:5,10-methylene-tetrahydrofolate dehydrogenase/methenyl tetrahydrofolate cyclohydrolase